MKQMLTNLKNNFVLCEIHSNLNDVDEFFVGYLICFDDDMLVFESVTSRGKYDGIYCILIESIVTIKYKTIYTTNLEKLMKHNDFALKNINFDEEALLDSVLKFAYSKGLMCEIALFDGDYSLKGYINSMDNNFITLNLIDSYGVPNGVAIAKINDISLAAFETEELVELEIFKS